MTSIVSVLSAILLLCILVVVHEAGHFAAARMVGIEVMEFSVGFGPRLFGWKSRRHDTKFSLRLIPLGGYCAFYGEDDAEGKHIDDPRAYARQSVWKRMFSVLMGPGMNFVLAFVVLMGFFCLHGATLVEPVLAAVEENGPAWEAGLRAGDVVTDVNGVNVRDGDAQTLSALIAAWQTGDAPLSIGVLRQGEASRFSMTPFWDEEGGRYRVGITISSQPRVETRPDGTRFYATQRLGLLESAQTSWSQCVYAGSMILDALKGLLTKGEGLDQTAGPVGVVSMVSQEVRAGGFEAFLNLLVIISINLGLMNLLPIPGLDGSRFLFMVVEALRGKPVSPRREAMVHLAGMAFLFAMMIFFTYKDVLRLLR